MTERAAGVFLHPTSLPSPFGIGDLGQDAIGWLDLLRRFDHTDWQVCPLSPTGYGDSPYQSLSSFAGNPLLISPARLVEDGLLTQADLDDYPRLPEDRVDFGAVSDAKDRLFRKAFTRFDDSGAFQAFCRRERYWLEDYARFRVLKDLHGGRSWTEWADDYRLRRKKSLRELAKTHGEALRYHKFLQFLYRADRGRGDLKWDHGFPRAAQPKCRGDTDLDVGHPGHLVSEHPLPVPSDCGSLHRGTGDITANTHDLWRQRLNVPSARSAPRRSS